MPCTWLVEAKGAVAVEWKNLGEHTVYENPWFRVRLAEVELPDGKSGPPTRVPRCCSCFTYAPEITTTYSRSKATWMA